MWKILRDEVKKKKSRFILYFIIQIGLTALSVTIPYLNGIFLDLISTTADRLVLFRFVVLFAVIGFFSVLLSYTVKMLKIKLKSILSYQLNAKVMNHLELIDYKEFNKFDAAYLTQRINLDSGHIIEFFIENCIIFFFSGIQLLFLLYFIMKFSLFILLAVLAFLCIYVFFYNLLKEKIFVLNNQYKESQNIFFNLFNKIISMNREIRSHSLYGESQLKMEKGFHSYYRDTVRYGRISSLFGASEGSISLAFQIVILIMGGLLIMGGKMSLGQYSVISIYFNMIISIVKYYFNIGKSYKEVQVSVDRILYFLNLQVESNGATDINDIHKISMEHVSFGYSNSKEILQGFTCEFTKGNLYAVRGENGSGKSTLLYLLISIFKNYTQGDICFDDINIKKLDLYKIRKKLISVYLQNEVTDYNLVKDFLSGDSTDKSDDVIKKKIIGLKAESLFLNNNFNILLYLDRCIDSLSSGERQKVFLLRALSRDTSIYMLDEPTSNLDMESKSDLMILLNEMKADKIIIIITHDEQVLSYADKIINVGTSLE